MSNWATIETTIASTLSGLTSGGAPLFATIRAVTWRDRKPLIAAIGRERMPAAYIAITSRGPGDKLWRDGGPVELSVFLAARNLRSDGGIRTGSTEGAGLFELVDAAAGPLRDLVIEGDRRLLLVEEKAAGGDEKCIVWEQQYELRNQSGMTPPRFGGVTLAGAESAVRVEIGPLGRASSTFAFPGIDGVFQRHLGTRERKVLWHGQLRAADDAALNAIEAGIEEELRSGRARTLVDPWGRAHESCVLDAFERRGPRVRDDVSGQARQGFEVTFIQLGG